MVFFDTPNEKDDSFEVLPTGSYRALVDNTEIKANRAGTGRLAVVTFRVLDGAHKGTTLKSFFNIEHNNPQAQRIGRSQFKTFLSAVGVTQALAHENEFHRLAAHKVLTIVVIVEKDDRDREQNRVTNYLSTTAPTPEAARPKPEFTNHDIPF